MGSLSRLKGKTRSAFGLATPPPMACIAQSERSERCLLIMILNKAAWLGTAWHRKKKASRRRAGRFTVPHWGLTGRRRIRIGKTNLCYFFKRLSRYCFLSCNRCSFMSNNGHLLIFNATFIFSHRSSSTFSIAAKSFMVLYRKDVLLKYSRRRVLLPQV